MIRREIQIFLTAVMFLTRIPCPSWVDHSADMLDKASRYSPLVGWIVGGIAALVFFGAVHVFPPAIAVLLSMIVSLVTTGAFHEDGFADVCDGFGGGWTAQQVLDIMKDSRLGTYGAAGLFSMLALKFATLFTIDVWVVPIVLIAGHAVSRFFSVFFIYTDEYARANEDSKAKPMAKKMSHGEFITAAFFGLLPVAIFDWRLLSFILPALIIKWWMGRWFRKRINGYTGDCLGAAQQVIEVSFYLFIIVFYAHLSYPTY